MMRVVRVLVEYAASAINRPFDYLIDDDLYVEKGVRVSINFGNKDIVGYVLDVLETPKSKDELEEEYGFELKYIKEVIDDAPLINDEIDKVVNYLSEETLSPLIRCYQTVLPPSLKPSSSKTKAAILTSKYYSLADSWKECKLNKGQLEIIEYFKCNKEVCSDDVPFSDSRMKLMVSKGIISVFYKEKYRKITLDAKATDWIKLNDMQEEALVNVESTDKTVSLLEGVTGSGKTEIYLRLVKKCIDEGKNALVLVPEISLTPLIIRRFKERFDVGIAIFHSGLSISEKYDEYRRIVRGEVRIVIGTRSAIFTPLNNLGIIIMDEEHSESYKQDNSPSYHAKDIAIFRAEYNKCKVVLGSATPSLESKARALKGIYNQIYLPYRVKDLDLPSTVIVDMNREIQNKNYSLFSNVLTSKIQDRLAKREQIMLFLNKRGYASYVTCRACRKVFMCPNCEVSMVYHKADNTLKCHYCGEVEEYPNVCPECGSKYIRTIGYGTQKVEEEIHKLFPSAKVARLDFDITTKKKELDRILNDFDDHKYDILLGTQLIAKGLDFPLVTLVGVIDADVGLNFSDFRSGERTFQLLTQVIGRCGRNEKKGEAIIQTHNPSNEVLKYAAKQDYKGYFKDEFIYRKIRKYPPFSHICAIVFKSKNYEEAMLVAMNTKKYFDSLEEEDLVALGPTIPFISKENGYSKVRILIKFKDKKKTLGIIKEVIDNLKDNSRVIVTTIMDPYDD